MRIVPSLTVLLIVFILCGLPSYAQEDLKVSISTSHVNANPGDEITYVIKYSNGGITPASDLIIKDYLSSSGLYTYVSSSPSGTVSGNVITWDKTQIQELALLSNGELQIAVTVKAGILGNGVTQASNGYYIAASPGNLENYATITSSQTTIPMQSNMVSTKIEQHCGVHVNNASGVIKSATNTMVYYLIQVTNNGNVYDRYDLSSINFDCDGPGELGFDAILASFTDQNGNPITKTDWIAPDQTYYFLLKLETDRGTNPGHWSCHNVVAISTVGGIKGEGNIQTKVEGSPHYALVSLSKIDAKDPVEAGETFTYKIYAFNSNDAYPATNMVVKETYPPNITFISSTPAPDPGFNNQWSLGNLNYGLSAANTINITVRVNPLNNCNGTMTNTVSASYDDYDSFNPPSASVVTTIKSYPDLVITKTAQTPSTPAKKGETITYTINYQNAGTCDAPNSQIRELFDDEHTNIISAGGGTQSGDVITWNLGLLTPGQSGTITYTVLIDPESTFTPGTTQITSKATISTSETEPNKNNNTAIASVSVSVLPDMKVEILPDNQTSDAGTEYTYTVKVSNVGDIAASNVEIKNLLPAGLTIGTIFHGGNNTGGTITWPVIPTFEMGTAVEYQVKVTPSCSFVPSFTSIASVTSSIIDKDETNNSTTVNFVVKEDVLPVLENIPPDVTVDCESIPAVGSPTATDNCDGAPIVYYLGEASTRGTNPLLPDYYNYKLTRSWEAVDAFGNHSLKGTQVITVEDVTPPEIPVLADVTVGQCSGTPVVPTTTDLCKGIITGSTTTVFPITSQGTNVVTWTFDDGNGNAITANQNVIVKDITAPVADVEDLAEVRGQCSATVTPPTATDNCKGKITGTTTDPLTYSEQGNYTIHWTYTDTHGNTSTQTQSVVVDDTTPPETPVLADVTVGECSGTPVAPTTTDLCKGIITGSTTTVFPITTQGTTVVAWTFDDSYGNIATVNQNVIVKDVTAPVPDIADLPVITGECSATATAPTATDNCKGKITGITTDPLTYSEQGTYTIHWTYNDTHGNAITANQNVIVKDITAPVPDVADLPVITGECSATVTAPTATDNCKDKIVGTTLDPLTYSELGNYTIHWIYDDGHGNTSTQTQSVVVEDTTPPETPVLADVTVVGCSGTPETPATTDLCKGTVTGTTTTVFPITTQGSTVVTWTFDDTHGNVITANQNVIVANISAPVPDIAILPTATGECSVTVNAPMATKNCQGKIVGTTTDPLTYSELGNYTIHWIYDDGNDNTSTQTQSVVVEDTTPPEAPVLADVTVGECSGTPETPTTTDLCKGTVTGTTTTVFPITTQGATVVTWTFDDSHGNAITANQNVIVKDITAPVPDIADLPVITAECSAMVTAPTATDNCKDKIVGTTLDPLTYSGQGNYTIHWTYDDGNGNAFTQEQAVIVDDTKAPVADLALLPTLTGQRSITVTAPTATDNCKGIITGTTPDPLTYTVQGNYTIHWTYDDGNGNTSTQTQNVVVDDSTPPETPVLADVTVGECSGTPVAPTTTDNTYGVITGTTLTAFPLTAQGTTIVTWTFDDGNGNITTANQNVIVDDVTAPVPNVADLPAITGECSATVTAPTATDNCKGQIVGNTTDPLTYSEQGIYTIHWTYDDGNGNTFTQTQNVVVDDTTPPETPVLADVFLGECSGTPPTPTTMDNCSGIIKGTTSILFPKTKQGKNTIIWTFDDGHGNVTTAYQNLILKDITAPVPDLATLPAITAECSATVTAPIATDNCKGKITATTTDPLTYSELGIYTIHWTYDDGNGNTSTQTQSVVVDDTTPPETPVLADVYLGECSGTPPTPTAMDNCSGIVKGTTSILFPKTKQGKNTIIWTFDDGHGNVTTAYQNLILEDKTAPVPDLATLPAITAECSATVTAPTATDNCKGKITATTTDPLTYSEQGIFTIHWTYNDGNGNTSTQTQSVEVDDTTPPETPVLADVTLGECSGTPIAPTTTDLCIGTITGTTTTVFPISSHGSTVVTWTFDDGNGNVTTAKQNVIIEDHTPPQITGTIAPITVQGCSAEEVTPLVNTVAALEAMGLSISDACMDDQLLTVSSKDVLSDETPLTVTRTYTIKDGYSSTDYKHTIMVVDTQKPTIVCPEDLTITADAGSCNVTGLKLSIPVTEDNCSVSSVTNDAPAVFGLGKIVVTWTVVDKSGNTAICHQNVTVDGIPVAMDDNIAVDENSQITGNVTTNDKGLCDTPIRMNIMTEPEFGSLTFSNDGSFKYIPGNNYSGKDKFTYQICDSDGDCSSATVEITINSVNDQPQANADTEDLQVDVTWHGNVAVNDVLSGDGNNVWTLETRPSNGTILFNKDGTYTYTPQTSFIGNDSFSYELCDANGDCSKAKVTIHIDDVLLPNQILTPNSDDHNDTFIINGIEYYPINKVTVYNRWGNVVYSKDNYQNEWDGVSKVSSKPLPVGTYYYLIDYGNNRHKTGFVYLDR